MKRRLLENPGDDVDRDDVDEAPVMQRCYVAIGANLDDPVRHVLRAIDELDSHESIMVTARSSLYRTDPMGPSDQPAYINAVVGLDTSLAPLALLDELQRLEQRHGRKRDRPRWTARPLDLDLLLYADQQIEHPRLKIPHPGITERSFVLLPLLEIAPGIHVPGRGLGADHAAELTLLGIERLENYNRV